MSALLLLVLAAAPVDPCAKVEPLPASSAREAAAYAEAGQSELAAGERDTALSAFREALRHNAANASARAGMARLCQEEGARAALRQGVEALEARRYGDAVEPLTRAYRVLPAPANALLLGIAHYELGREQAARPLLEKARTDPALADDAAFYLGLIAYGSNRPGAAISLFETVRTDPRLEAAASRLLRLSRQKGPLLLSALVQGLYDSNPSLAPDSTPQAGVAGDGALDATLLARFSVPGTGLFVQGSGEYRGYLQQHDGDFAALGARAGVEVEGQHAAALLEYDYSFLALGGAPYLSAHRLLGAVRGAAGPLSAGASYSARLEQFLPTGAAPYSGLRHTGRLDVAWAIDALTLGLAYQGALHTAQVQELAFAEHGPTLELRFRPLGRLRLSATGGVMLRGYGAVDPDFGVRRSDVYVDAEAAAELPLVEGLSAQLAVGGREAFSNVAALQYTRVSCAVRLAYTLGLP